MNTKHISYRKFIPTLTLNFFKYAVFTTFTTSTKMYTKPRYKYEGCIDYSPCLQYAAVEMLCCNKKRFDVDEDEVIREASGRRVYS